MTIIIVCFIFSIAYLFKGKKIPTSKKEVFDTVKAGIIKSVLEKTEGDDMRIQQALRDEAREFMSPQARYQMYAPDPDRYVAPYGER